MSVEYVSMRLKEYYTDQEIEMWLTLPHPQLDNKRAIDLINDGHTDEVVRVIDALDECVYL